MMVRLINTENRLFVSPLSFNFGADPYAVHAGFSEPADVFRLSFLRAGFSWKRYFGVGDHYVWHFLSALPDHSPKNRHVPPIDDQNTGYYHPLHLDLDFIWSLYGERELVYI